MLRNAEVQIGTSGWHYAHWKGPFYPATMASKEFLAFYTKHFQTVEINNTFYRLPNENALNLWKETAPKNFVFSVKASRLITHMKRLNDPKEPLKSFLDRINLLGEKLGPILFQLPPHWQINIERLREFLTFLPSKFRYAFEFRDPSWYHDEVYDALKKAGAAFCIYNLAGHWSPAVITADLVYLRLHGPGGPYQGSYPAAVLSEWAKKFLTWSGEGRRVYCYFDNDQAGYAAQDALRLKEMLGAERKMKAA